MPGPGGRQGLHSEVWGEGSLDHSPMATATLTLPSTAAAPWLAAGSLTVSPATRRPVSLQGLGEEERRGAFGLGLLPCPSTPASLPPSAWLWPWPLCPPRAMAALTFLVGGEALLRAPLTPVAGERPAPAAHLQAVRHPEEQAAVLHLLVGADDAGDLAPSQPRHCHLPAGPRVPFPCTPTPLALFWAVSGAGGLRTLGREGRSGPRTQRTKPWKSSRHGDLALCQRAVPSVLSTKGPGMQ